MINKYIEFNSLNESKDEPKFKVGDTVTVNDELLNQIRDYDWSYEMKKFIGGTFFIDRIVYEDRKKRYRYYIVANAYVFDDCLEPVEPPKVRWYKKGKLEND
jgi:hypothetical protein